MAATATVLISRIVAAAAQDGVFPLDCRLAVKKKKALAKLRQEKKCVYVGTYCAEKLPFIGCIRRKSNFCCFGTKLARLIHEQGRPQLKMTFGDVEHPQCRGFTVEELTKLDFEKIDLSELLSELYSKFKAPNVSKLSQDFSQDWKHRIPTMEKEVKPPLQTIKEETKDAVFLETSFFGQENFP